MWYIQKTRTEIPDTTPTNVGGRPTSTAEGVASSSAPHWPASAKATSAASVPRPVAMTTNCCPSCVR